MKSVLLALALVASVSAFADPLRTYECAAPRSGDVTVSRMTLRANAQNLVMNFPGHRVDEVVTASFSRASRDRVPSVIADRSGGEFFAKSNASSLIREGNTDYEPMYAFATNGLIRGSRTGARNLSGNLIVVYKKTFADQPSSNMNEWSREYRCTARRFRK